MVTTHTSHKTSLHLPDPTMPTTTTTSTATAASTCPASPTSMPDFSTLPIPQNVNVFGTPGNDTSAYPPMTACCAPNPVQIVDGCYLWCELPAQYFNGTSGKQGAEDAFKACLAENKGTEEGERISGFQMNSAGRMGGLKGWTVGMVLLLGLAVGL